MTVSYSEVETGTSKLANGNRVVIDRHIVNRAGLNVGDKLCWYYDGEKILIAEPDSPMINGDESVDDFYNMNHTIVSNPMKLIENRRLTMPKSIRDLMNISQGDYVKIIYDGEQIVSVPVQKEEIGL